MDFNMNVIQELEREEAARLKETTPDFNAGDTVKVYFKVIEGGKERIQAFEGFCLKRQNTSVRSTFTVRKISHNQVGVERTFPLYSPKIDRIEVLFRGRVRRARLFYQRGRRGKAARIKELRTRV
jgi:large subunit ribosomal protein L19